MKDITIIIPLHVFNDEVKDLLTTAIESVSVCQKNYENIGKLTPLIVCSSDIYDSVMSWVNKTKQLVSVIKNTGDTDFCSQVNHAVATVKTEFFSVLEFDDTYTEHWFTNAHKYYYGNESVSVFLPVNLFHDGQYKNWQYGNTMALSPTFITNNEKDKDDIGIINFHRLEKCSLFNLTGAVINTEDFRKVGMYKPSIKVAFNYELLLRMAKKGLIMMVVPKEGYVHALGRKDSLTDVYLSTTTEEEREKWFKLAVRECKYDEDRKKTVSTVKEETIK